jgi:hypothetical protein
MHVDTTDPIVTEPESFPPAPHSPRRHRAMEAVMRAIETVSPATHGTQRERGVRLAAAREAVALYVKSLRDEGQPVATVVAQVKALVRGIPARNVGSLRDALARWTISAYYQAD